MLTSEFTTWFFSREKRIEIVIIIDFGGIDDNSNFDSLLKEIKKKS